MTKASWTARKIATPSEVAKRIENVDRGVMRLPGGVVVSWCFGSYHGDTVHVCHPDNGRIETTDVAMATADLLDSLAMEVSA